MEGKEMDSGFRLPPRQCHRPSNRTGAGRFETPDGRIAKLPIYQYIVGV